MKFTYNIESIVTPNFLMHPRQNACILLTHITTFDACCPMTMCTRWITFLNTSISAHCFIGARILAEINFGMSRTLWRPSPSFPMKGGRIMAWAWVKVFGTVTQNMRLDVHYVLRFWCIIHFKGSQHTRIYTHVVSISRIIGKRSLNFSNHQKTSPRREKCNIYVARWVSPHAYTYPGVLSPVKSEYTSPRTEK